MWRRRRMVVDDAAANRAGGDAVAQWDAIFASIRGHHSRNSGGASAPAGTAGKSDQHGIAGWLEPWPTHAHYCSSKAALHMLTKVMAKALAPEIAVNAVAPGMIDLGEKAAKEFMRKMARVTPMKRNGTGDEIAAAVRFFAEAPHFITGQILVVDGGLSL